MKNKDKQRQWFQIGFPVWKDAPDFAGEDCTNVTHMCRNAPLETKEARQIQLWVD